MTQWDLCMLWNLLGPTGICWDHLHRPGPVGTHWDLLGPAMTQWDPCMLWDLLGSHTPGPTGSHWDALGALHTWGTTAGPLRLAVTGMHWCRYPPSPALPQYLHRGGPAAPLEPREEGEGGPQLAEPLLAPTGGHEQLGACRGLPSAQHHFTVPFPVPRALRPVTSVPLPLPHSQCPVPTVPLPVPFPVAFPLPFPCLHAPCPLTSNQRPIPSAPFPVPQVPFPVPRDHCHSHHPIPRPMISAP